MLEQYPFIEATVTEEERLLTLKKQFFKPSDFPDTLLLYSDALSNKIITYLGLYRNPDYIEEQQTNEFIKAADQLLTAVKYSTGIAPSSQGKEGVGLYILKYVIEGFNQIKQDALHILPIIFYPKIHAGKMEKSIRLFKKQPTIKNHHWSNSS